VTDDVFEALADPTRRAVFERLSRDGTETGAAHGARRGSFPFRRFWSKHVDALEQHLEKMEEGTLCERNERHEQP
jgi:DNA-binding transcriptional ArsR family regulator